jgi:hypothetical protein
MDNRLRGKEAAIRVLEAAGKVDKEICQDLIDVLFGENIIVGQNDTRAARQLGTIIESLPEPEKEG